MQKNICVAITPGEPAGIGPEITLKLAKHSLDYGIVAIASHDLLQQQAKKLGLDIKLKLLDESDNLNAHTAGELPVIDVPLSASTTFGSPNVDASRYVIATLETAIESIQAGTIQALTTAPVQKSIINDAGIAFTGHTEFIADKTGGYPVMLLANETPNKTTHSCLRVALVTTHLAMRDVANNITADKITHVISVLHHDLIHRFGIKAPNISVCGLNPHAGEGGHLGVEENEVIIPALEKLRRQGMQIEGPLPADTAFTQKKLMGKDAIVAMYHDQGLPVIKHQGFGEVVNITLGLPIIRTSVDHGTALDIAGQGIADESSLLAATNLASTMYQNTV